MLYSNIYPILIIFYMSYGAFSNFKQILIFCEGVRCGNLRTCQVFISAPINRKMGRLFLPHLSSIFFPFWNCYKTFVFHAIPAIQFCSLHIAIYANFYLIIVNEFNRYSNNHFASGHFKPPHYIYRHLIHSHFV